MFPGQGSQYIGMGKEFYDSFPVAKEVFDKASEVTGLDIAKLCFEENDRINITEYTQICMLTEEVALNYACIGVATAARRKGRGRRRTEPRRICGGCCIGCNEHGRCI